MHIMRQRFTLLELLVVVAVMGILIGMLFPALNVARQTAKRIGCIGNLKNIGLGFEYYASDNNEYIPWGLYWYDYSSGSKVQYWPDVAWQEKLKGYLGNPKNWGKRASVIHCTALSNKPDNPNFYYSNTYGINSSIQGMKRTRLPVMSKRYLLVSEKADIGFALNTNSFPGVNRVGVYVAGGFVEDKNDGRHNMSTNNLYLDGSVSSMTAKEKWDEYSLGWNSNKENIYWRKNFYFDPEDKVQFYR